MKLSETQSVSTQLFQLFNGCLDILMQNKANTVTELTLDPLILTFLKQENTVYKYINK